MGRNLDRPFTPSDSRGGPPFFSNSFMAPHPFREPIRPRSRRPRTDLPRHPAQGRASIGSGEQDCQDSGVNTRRFDVTFPPPSPHDLVTVQRGCQAIERRRARTPRLEAVAHACRAGRPATRAGECARHAPLIIRTLERHRRLPTTPIIGRMTPGPGAAMPCGVVRSLVLALAVGSLAFAATRVGGEPAGELRVGVARLPDPLDPIAPVPAGAGVVFRHIFQGLVDIGERGDIEPGLAAQWSVSRDGLIWTFHLRPDVQFHNGVSLTADVVVASLARLPTGEEAATREAAEPWLGLFRGKNAVVREIRRGDRGTVQMVLAQPFSPLLAALAHPALAIVVTERDSRVPVLGTGPYRVAEQSATRLVLEAVPGAPDPPLGTARLRGGRRRRRRARRAGARRPARRALPAGAAGLGRAAAFRCSRDRPGRWASWRCARTRVSPAARRSAARSPRASTPRSSAPRSVGWLARIPAICPRRRGRSDRPRPPARADPGASSARRKRQRGRGPHAARRPSSDDELEPARLAEALRLSLAVAGLTLKVRPEPPATYEPALRKGEGELALAEVALPLDDPHFLLRPLVASDGAAARERDERRVLPQSRRRRPARCARARSASGPERLPPVPAAPGAARRGPALHSPLRSAPVGGFRVPASGTSGSTRAAGTVSTGCRSRRRPRPRRETSPPPR